MAQCQWERLKLVEFFLRQASLFFALAAFLLSERRRDESIKSKQKQSAGRDRGRERASESGRVSEKWSTNYGGVRQTNGHGVYCTCSEVQRVCDLFSYTLYGFDFHWKCIEMDLNIDEMEVQANWKEYERPLLCTTITPTTTKPNAHKTNKRDKCCQANNDAKPFYRFNNKSKRKT